MQNRKLMQNTVLVPSWLVLFGQAHAKCSVNVRVFLTSERLDTLSSSFSSPHSTSLCKGGLCSFSLYLAHTACSVAATLKTPLGNLLLSQPFSAMANNA